jgi:hypothetical protein
VELNRLRKVIKSIRLFRQGEQGIERTRGEKFAQATAQPATSIPKTLAFDVAAIKPGKDDGRWKMDFTPNGFTAMNVPLRRVIQEAYGLYEESR